ncbi:acetate--CoA ligase [Peredibacter starrii]|uniref:Acetate--CoA ligase n=1 Tax=Peredibacter starrii TaxID=28202 RepID=A0AAX4HMS2_9BACT|nr:acetate--CoA ligase [Peredibacter starrii]WPU64500.1 acetate--CoA ligase [Peredibacter starrii]
MTPENMYPVKSAVKTKSYLKGMEAYQEMYERSIKDPEGFWLEAAKNLDWFKFPEKAGQGDFKRVNHSWFMGGKLNVTYNCLDRHLAKRGNKSALIWAKDEPGQYQNITYQEVYENVCRLTNLLEAQGVKKGDRVCIYLPMIPELVYSVLACARLGAVHSVVFGGFSADSLKGRIIDAECKIVITANEGLRGGKKVPLKNITDDAIKDIDFVKTVLVVNRTSAQVNMVEGRDYNYEEEIKKYRPVAPCATVDAEDPLFILYTSGSTGKPKGVMHTSGGYLTYAAFTHRYIFDYHEDDVYFCTADVGWVTGHSYVVYGPLANGATSVLFESIPSYPDAGRYWQVIQDLKATIFYTAPTALRSLAQSGDEIVKKYDRSSLRILGTVGEPINPEIWKWYHDVVGESRCDIVDTWWQTETGGILITPIPGVTPTKPGSATLPFFGVQPLIVKPENGEEVKGNGVEGALCIKSSWPGQARTIYKDHARFVETYFTQYPGLYFTGDGCRRDEDGYYWITGRIDDVLNVSGHRLGTAEVESALMEHPEIAEAAVVGYPHDIKGVGIHAYVILYEHKESTKELVESIKDVVREKIGRFAAPDIIHITKGLPKTRSGKVMRRILRKIASHEYGGLGDTSTLSEPGVVDNLVEEHKKLK